MFNATTIGAGLGRTPSRLLAWGLGDGVTTATPVDRIYFTNIGLSQPMLTDITVNWS